MISEGEIAVGVGELLLLAVGLSMDAFAVAVCKGLALRQPRWRDAALVGLWFGAFQAGMPLLGYALGARFSSYVQMVDHWIAFFLLAAIGVNMIREAVKGEEETLDAGLGLRAMLPLAVATSIDALAVGVTFAFLEEGRSWIGVGPAVLMIGTVTFCLSGLGVRLGSHFGSRYERRAQLAGGVILLLLGLRILLRDLLGG